MTAPTELLDAEAIKKAAFAVFAKANEGNLQPETIEKLWPSQHYPHWDGLAEAAVRAYFSALPASEAAWGDSPAAIDVLAERRRQVEAEGWTAEHNDSHSNGELAAAASCYAYPNANVRKLVPSRWDVGRSLDDDDIPVGRTNVPANWPDWDGDWWKPSDRRRNLVKAGALILAEIERLDRLPSAPDRRPA